MEVHDLPEDIGQQTAIETSQQNAHRDLECFVHGAGQLSEGSYLLEPQSTSDAGCPSKFKPVSFREVFVGHSRREKKYEPR